MRQGAIRQRELFEYPDAGAWQAVTGMPKPGPALEIDQAGTSSPAAVKRSPTTRFADREVRPTPARQHPPPGKCA